LAERTYHYLAPPMVEPADIGLEVVFATSGGPTKQPHFFIRRPRQIAHELLAVAEVARTRYYEPPGMQMRT
jgi:hypothetical protein